MSRFKDLGPAIALGVMGNSVIYMIPLLVGGMVSDRGFSEQAAGYMASADLGGYALATFLTAMVITRWSWHRLAFAGLAVILVANVLTTFTHDVLSFAGIRVVSGFGCGVLAALASVSVGQSDNPDRNYGLLLAAALLFGTAALWGMPWLLTHYGLNSAYWLLSVLAIASCFVVPRLPEWHAPAAAGASVGGAGTQWFQAVLVLAAILIFWAAQNDVYAYIERVGNAASLDAEFIGFTLGVANLTGFVGASLVAAMGTRFGRLVPLIIATLVQIACIVVLTHDLTPWRYLVAISATSLSWNVVNPFQLGSLAGVDRTGKALALAATVTGAGLAIGPAAAATALGHGGYEAVLWLSGILEVVALVLVMPSLRPSAQPALQTL